MPRLTKKGEIDKRSEVAPKNIKKALETRKKIFQEYNEKKKMDSGEEIPVESSESYDSYDSDSDKDEIIISTKRPTNKKSWRADPIPEKKPEPIKSDPRMDKLESMIKELTKQKHKKETKQKKTVIQIAQPQKPPKPEPSQFEQHLKRKILNF